MIDYKLLDNSITFYQEKGFKRIESPWTVTKAVSEITKPLGSAEFELKERKKVLVASGEQSFLYLYLKGFLPKGSFQTITPCFRDEPFDDLHSKYFIKNELIITDDVTNNMLLHLVKTAKEFYEQYLPVNIIETNNGFDIEYKQMELGSYGIRKCNFLHWIYGTACAEPRTSYLINLHKKLTKK